MYDVISIIYECMIICSVYECMYDVFIIITVVDKKADTGAGASFDPAFVSSTSISVLNNVPKLLLSSKSHTLLVLSMLN